MSEKFLVGSFKSTDCQPVIKEALVEPTRLAKAGGAEFGTAVQKQHLAVNLGDRGVRIENPGKKPIKYEMTSEAKATV